MEDKVSITYNCKYCSGYVFDSLIEFLIHDVNL